MAYLGARGRWCDEHANKPKTAGKESAGGLLESSKKKSKLILMFHMSMLRALEIQVERYKLCFFQNILLSTPQNPIRNACILEVHWEWVKHVSVISLWGKGKSNAWLQSPQGREHWALTAVINVKIYCLSVFELSFCYSSVISNE